MLNELVVTNLVIVKEARLHPGGGLTVISGETGAGKSLLLDALGLICGGRAQGQTVGPWAEHAQVSAVFAVSDAQAVAINDAAGVNAAEGQFILRRRIAANGRSQAWINDVPVTLAALRAVTDRLVEIHAQHEPLRLANPAVQRAWLDEFGGLTELAARYHDLHQRTLAQIHALADLDGGERESVKELDYLRFQLQEIEALKPKRGELTELDQRHALLASAGEWQQLAAAAVDELSDGDAAVVRRLGRLARRLDDAPDDALRSAGTALHQAIEMVNDAARTCTATADALTADPAELERIGERLNAWHDLLRKHGDGEDALFTAWERLSVRADALANLDARRAALAAEVDALKTQRAALGRELAKRRASAFIKLAKAVHAHLAELGMPKAKLTLLEQPLLEPGPDGALHQEFQVCTNPGMPPGTLRDIASGGELARIALAVTTALADADRLPVLVFDEVDSGVGGRLGAVIGAKLARLSTDRSVLAITHTPQLAACAHRHYVVRKHQGERETQVVVQEIRGEARARELSDMLGGGDAAFRQAQSLLSAAGTGA